MPHVYAAQMSDIETLAGSTPRIYPGGNMYVNAATGNDNNDGKASNRAWKTIARAMAEIDKYTRFHSDVYLYLADGVYADPIILTNKHFQLLNIRGNTEAPETVQIPNLVVKSCTGCLELYGLFISSNIKISAEFKFVQSAFFWKCKIDNNNFADGIGLSANYSSVGFNSSIVQNSAIALYAATGGKVYSGTNTGSGNGIVLRAINSGTIHKAGTQPTGITAEYKTDGGQIW